jgi:hypothetical protein
MAKATPEIASLRSSWQRPRGFFAATGWFLVHRDRGESPEAKSWSTWSGSTRPARTRNFPRCILQVLPATMGSRQVLQLQHPSRPLKSRGVFFEQLPN